MQAINKLEQPNSPSSISTDYSSSYYSPKSSKELMQTLTRFLETGQQSALQMRGILNKRLGFKAENHDGTICCDDVDDHDNDHNESHQVFDHHTRVTLSSFQTCLSIIKSFDLGDNDDDDLMMINKRRKLDHHHNYHPTSDVECSDHSSKSDEVIDAAKVPRERRGCYKRRRNGQSQTVVAPTLIDDGFAWRKYGQKDILNTNYPRNYYRCTHKVDQNCQATKQVQQISENPTKYKIIYNGQHTCKNLLKTPSIILEPSSEENSSFYLSFDTKNHPSSSAKHALTPSLFPSSAFHHNNNNNNPTTMVKQEQTSPTPIETETPLVPHDHDHDHRSGAHQDSSSSDNQPRSSSSLSDLTSTELSSSTTTPVSDQGSSDVISSLAELYSSTANPYYMDDDLISLIGIDDNQCCPLDDSFWDFLRT